MTLIDNKMKKYKILILLLTSLIAFSSCEKDDPDGPVGADGYDNFYYAGFLPWNNTATASVLRTQTDLVKFPVQFHSSFVRNYDAAAHFTLVTTGITNPAVVGQDFNVVDKSGNAIQATNGIYSLNFPQAKAKVDTIYFKVLNNTLPGTRRIEINLVQNENSQYKVGTFTQAFKRFLEVR